METKSWKDIKDNVYEKKELNVETNSNEILNHLKSGCFYGTLERKKN